MKKTRFTTFKRFIKQDDGIVAVEFALISTLFLAFLVGIYATGIYFFTLNRLQYGTETAARYAAVHDDTTTGDLQQIVSDSMDVVSIDPAQLAVTVSDSSANGMDFKVVSASYRYTWSLPFLPDDFNNIELTASSRMAVR